MGGWGVSGGDFLGGRGWSGGTLVSSLNATRGLPSIPPALDYSFGLDVLKLGIAFIKSPSDRFGVHFFAAFFSAQ